MTEESTTELDNSNAFVDYCDDIGCTASINERREGVNLGKGGCGCG